MKPTFYEFFAGGGMARIGLGARWNCEFANDISPMKAEAYCVNFPQQPPVLVPGDINQIVAERLPGHADLIWGSFPCQDLSLAGSGGGLSGSRSGLIWRLLDISERLKKQGRGPKAIVLENVTGLLNSRHGQDFYDILRALVDDGFLFGTLMMDAIHFLPHSRPRVFLVAIDTKQVTVTAKFVNGRLRRNYPWTSARLDKLWNEAPVDLRENWVWWNLPTPPQRQTTIESIIDHRADNWDSDVYTAKLIQMMAPLHVRKVQDAATTGKCVVGTLYRRTRASNGVRSQRVEVRFDGVSGCLRTPTGGSSRQRLLFVRGGSVRSRLLTAREAARLMGIPENYRLPASYNDAYQIAGDGVAVPVVEWLSKHLLLPLTASQSPTVADDEVPLLYA